MSFEYHRSKPDWGKPRSNYTPIAELHAELSREYSRIDASAKATLEQLQAKRDAKWLKVPFAGDPQINELAELRHRCKVTFENCVQAVLHASQLERQQGDAENKQAMDSNTLELATKELRRIRDEYDALSSEKLELSLARDKQLGSLGDLKNKRAPLQEVAVYESKKVQLEQERNTLVARFANGGDGLAAIANRRIEVESSLAAATKALEASRADVSALKATWVEASAAQTNLAMTSAAGLSQAVSTLAHVEKAGGASGVLDAGSLQELVATVPLSDAAREKVSKQQADSKNLSRQAATSVASAEQEILRLEAKIAQLKDQLQENDKEIAGLIVDAELVNEDFNEPSYDQDKDPMDLQTMLDLFVNRCEVVTVEIDKLNEEIEVNTRALHHALDQKARREKAEWSVKADGAVQIRRRMELEKRCAAILLVGDSKRNYSAESGAAVAAAKVQEQSRSIERLTNAISTQEVVSGKLRAEKESLETAEFRIKKIDQELV